MNSSENDCFPLYNLLGGTEEELQQITERLGDTKWKSARTKAKFSSTASSYGHFMNRCWKKCSSSNTKDPHKPQCHTKPPDYFVAIQTKDGTSEKIRLVQAQSAMTRQAVLKTKTSVFLQRKMFSYAAKTIQQGTVRSHLRGTQHKTRKDNIKE